MKSILKEESMINITLKLIDQEVEVFLAEDPQVALLKLKCFQELINKEKLTEVFEMIGDDAYRNLGFILQQFVHDSYSIQLSIIRQLPLLVEQIKKRQSGLVELKDHVLTQKIKKKILSCRSRNSGSSSGHLEDIPEFDEKIEQIRKSSGKV